jgi:hypothetical protein
MPGCGMRWHMMPTHERSKDNRPFDIMIPLQEGHAL